MARTRFAVVYEALAIVDGKGLKDLPSGVVRDGLQGSDRVRAD